MDKFGWTGCETLVFAWQWFGIAYRLGDLELIGAISRALAPNYGGMETAEFLDRMVAAIEAVP